MFTYKKAPYKIFALGPKFCWAGPVGKLTTGVFSSKTEENVIFWLGFRKSRGKRGWDSLNAGGSHW